MNFFQKLAETGIENVVIEVKKSEAETITVFITPKSKAKDEALNKLKPIFVTGLPEEIDAEFFNLISEPLRDTQKVFSNIEAYEAQKAEIQKETAEKKDAKAKATADAKKSPTVMNENGEIVPATATGKPVKEVVINNEKVLKEFMTSIKGENILSHKDKIEELYALCNEVELDKAFAKKVRIDLDIAIRKQKNIDDARAKMGLVPKLDIPTEETIVETETAEIVIAEEKTETESSTLTEKEIEEIATQEPPLTTKESFKQRNAIPEAIQQIADASPNVIIATVPGPEQVQPIAEEMEVVGEINIKPEPISITPPPPPAPPVILKRIIEMTVLKMISTDGTQEDYEKAGWTVDQLIQHGKAHWVTIEKEVEEEVTSAAPTSLKYEFPKPFDAPEQQ